MIGREGVGSRAGHVWGHSMMQIILLILLLLVISSSWYAPMHGLPCRPLDDADNSKNNHSISYINTSHNTSDKNITGLPAMMQKIFSNLARKPC